MQKLCLLVGFYSGEKGHILHTWKIQVIMFNNACYLQSSPSLPIKLDPSATSAGDTCGDLFKLRGGLVFFQFKTRHSICTGWIPGIIIINPMYKWAV